jgi:hypothetical protein
MPAGKHHHDGPQPASSARRSDIVSPPDSATRRECDGAHQPPSASMPPRPGVRMRRQRGWERVRSWLWLRGTGLGSPPLLRASGWRCRGSAWRQRSAKVAVATRPDGGGSGGSTRRRGGVRTGQERLRSPRWPMLRSAHRQAGWRSCYEALSRRRTSRHGSETVVRSVQPQRARQGQGGRSCPTAILHRPISSDV